MYYDDKKIQALIQKNCMGKKHIKLTIGTYAHGKETIQVFAETGEIPNENYIYEIGSITKTFTCSLLAKYIYEGEMSLDNSISKYISGLDNNKYYPTLKRLATHTSGYPSRLPFDGGEYFKLMLGILLSGVPNQGKLPFNLDLNKMKKLLFEYKLQDKDYPWKYSNFGFALIGHAIGIVSNKGYWDTMNDFLLAELGLQQSYTGTYTGIKLQGFNNKNQLCGNWNWGKDYTAPAGDISSTATDLITYAKINMHEEKPYLSLCHQKHADCKKTDMGLGWMLRKDNNKILSHDGETGAFYSYLTFDKSKKVACVVLSNYRIDMRNKIGMSVLEYLQRN